MSPSSPLGPRAADAPDARVGDGCLRWLERHRASFEPFREDDPVLSKRLLAFGELAGIMGNILRRGGAPQRVRALAAFVDDGLDGVDWEAQTIRSPRMLLAPITMHRLRTALGRDARHLHDVIARFVRLGRADALDLEPYRRFEMEELLAGGGFKPLDRGAIGGALRAALAPLAVPPSSFTAQDGYALTHIVFALCDHGRREPGALLHAPAEVARLRRLVALCARMALIERNVDLLGELVACARFLAIDEDWLVPASFALAASAQDADGSIPTYEREPEVEDGRFFGRYHATLMWAYAAA
jgi:hypothetical protein